MNAPPAVTDLRVCIDVDDVERAITFYTEGVGLAVGRRFDRQWIELVGAPISIDLLGRAPGTSANASAGAPARTYQRHWTPVHLDFVVPDMDAAVERIHRAGGALEGAIESYAYGRLARMADPWGHGFCLLEFRGRGYDEVLA